MKNIKMKMIAMGLTITMMISTLCFNVNANESPVINVDTIFSVSTDAQEIYETTNIVSYEDILTTDYELNDGLTVICGSDISLDNLSFDGQISSVASEINKNSLNSAQSDYINTPATESNTYMVLCMKKGERVDLQYVSVTYEKDVNASNVETFITAELSDSAVDSRVRDFICGQVTDTSSAYNAVSSVSLLSSPTTKVVLRITDTNYYIANYNISSGSYPLMIFKKDITYEATLVANDLDEDSYIIMAYVYLTPGNDISSFTAAEYASMSASGIYNDDYSNAIAIKGIKTTFFNFYPEKDRFIDMAPKTSIDDVNNETISISLGVPPSISLSFNVTTSTRSKINMTTEFNATGQCKVQFEAFKRFLSITRPNLSTEQFTYNAGVYMSSGSNVLNTGVSTIVKYYFQNADSDSAIWVDGGGTFALYYENEN